MNSIAQFSDAIRKAGLTPPDCIEADGKLRRFASNGKRGDDSGWYVFHADTVPAGAFGCWRSGISETWRGEPGKQFTPAEEAAHKTRIDTMRKQREAEETKRRAKAKDRAAAVLQSAKQAETHPYLTAKRIHSYGLRETDEVLVIPMRDTAGEVHSLQFISPNGDKRFLPGGKVSGCYYGIGRPNGVLYIAEGYATGATVHEVTGHSVAIAFNAGNLIHVATALRKKFPQTDIIIAGDNDVSGVGQRAATEAAQAINGAVAIPEQQGCDWNDVYCQYGLEAAQVGLRSAVADMPSASVSLIQGSSLKPESIEWMWNGFLACGKLHIIAGAPGAGKTTIALAFAATLSVGGRWPDGTRATSGNVLVWSGEDDPKDTLLPRLIAMGADTNRVYFVGDTHADGKSRPFDPSRDMAALEYEAKRIGGVRLVIVDPIVNAVAGDSHKNTETRRALQPIVELAARLRAAAIGISHFSKGTAGRDPVERVTGSVAFGALARIVFGAAKGTDEDGAKRLLVRAKSNVGPDGGGFGYDLEQTDLASPPGITASRVLWGAALDGTARDLLAEAEATEEQGDRNATEEAIEWLRDKLKDGPVTAKEAQREARADGISDKALRCAREQLGVKSYKSGFAKGWMWDFPEGVPRCPEDAHHKNRASSEKRASSQFSDQDAQTLTKMPKIPEGAQILGEAPSGHLRNSVGTVAGEGEVF